MRTGEILVLGAGGFVGGWLLKEIRNRARGGVTAWPDSHADHVDVLDLSALASLFAARRPTAVVNLAAVASPGEAKRAPQLAWDVNVQGAMNVARAILEASPHSRLIQVGSSEQYGTSFLNSTAPLSEAALLQPMTTYGATKAAADIVVGQLHHEGLHAVRFRPFNHTGPGQAPIYVVAAFARQVARIELGLQPPILEVGNLAPVRDFLDVRDVVGAYVDAALHEDPAIEGRAFNLASGNGIRIGAILDRLLSLAGVTAEIRSTPVQSRRGEVEVATGDASAAREAFGWSPRLNFDQTLTDVLQDWRGRAAAEPSTGP